MYAALKRHLYTWIFRPRGPQTGVIVLSQRRVFILPTTQGVVFGVVLAVMLLGSINYSLSLGFVLTFLLGAMGLNAMIYTFRNVANLRISAGRAEPVFAGDKAHFAVIIDNPRDADRYSLGLTKDGAGFSFTDVPAHASSTATASVQAARRGLLRAGRLTLFTCYPLGLFTAWSYLELEMSCIVYPRPAASAPPLPAPEASAGEGPSEGRGQDDFAGLRQYQPGDSLRHVAWKAAARGQGLLTKQFSGNAQTRLWLDWQRLPRELDVEARLSVLTRWVLDAHALGVAYGLRLPGRSIPIAQGGAQRNACLEALALFGSENEILQSPDPRPA